MVSRGPFDPAPTYSAGMAHGLGIGLLVASAVAAAFWFAMAQTVCP